MNRFPTIPFISILLIIIGGDLLFDRLNLLYTTWYELLGTILMVQGVLFLIYGIRDKNNSKTVSGVILSGAGVLFFFPAIVDQIDWDFIWDNLFTWWPAVLILIGLWILIKSWTKKSEN
ncbi:MAG: DUF5668 domain-containing protein [Bacteroidetes bacterium]|nr:DUF5668 domain-containing protein [Bacteroidota bacterium]